MNWPLMKDTVTLRDRLKLAKFILTSSKLTGGPRVKEFEKKWSEWLGTTFESSSVLRYSADRSNGIYSLFVSSGSTANFLLLAATIERYGLKRGDKVVVPACTWVTNVAPIIQLGLEPVFCDINLENYSFDLEHLKELAVKHNDIKAVFITHLLGFSSCECNVRQILPKALILEDVCESHGCHDIMGRKCGPNNVGGTFSFYFGHHMTTVEGGMVSTTDRELYDIMRMKRSHGLARESSRYQEYASQYPDIIPSFLFMTDGYNFRNSDIGAVLGLSQLERLDKMIDIRNSNYMIWWELMMEYYDDFELPEEPNNRMSSFAFPFISRNKESHQHLMDLFDEYGIEYRPIVSGNLLKQPFLKDFRMEREVCFADTLNERGCYIGNNHFVGEPEFEILAEVLERVKQR